MEQIASQEYCCCSGNVFVALYLFKLTYYLHLISSSVMVTSSFSILSLQFVILLIDMYNKVCFLKFPVCWFCFKILKEGNLKRKHKQEAVLQLSLTQNYCLVISEAKLHVVLACDTGIKAVVVLSYTNHSRFGNDENSS